MNKVVITPSEVQAAELPVDTVSIPKLPKPIALWARLAVLPLVLALPVLCLFTLIVRIAIRAMPPRTREAWNSYTNSLLIVSGLMFTGVATIFIVVNPSMPQSFSSGLVQFDERASFPELPSTGPMQGTEVAQTLRPLVVVASPAARSWFTRGEMLSAEIGTAFLISANNDGYLFATAKHVVDGIGWRRGDHDHILLNSGQGAWTRADIVGRHQTLDLALIFVPRHGSHALFHQPLASPEQVKPGEDVYVIGHPEGLQFSMSKGIVSRLEGNVVQISAPISPGNSGGPVYDDRGALIGIVTSKVDRNAAPNAEELGFAVSSTALAERSGWDLSSIGEQAFNDYQKQTSLTPGKN